MQANKVLQDSKYAPTNSSIGDTHWVMGGRLPILPSGDQYTHDIGLVYIIPYGFIDMRFSSIPNREQERRRDHQFLHYHLFST